MNRLNSIKKNFLMNGLLMLSSILFSVVSFPYVSRVLRPAGMGRVSFALSLTAYFNMFAQLGIPTYGIRACARLRNDRRELSRTAQELTLINLLLAIPSYALLLAAAAFVPALGGERALYAVVGSSILFNAVGMEWLYKGLEQYGYIAARSALFRLLSLIGIFLLVRGPEDYLLYGAMTVLAASAGGAVNLFAAGRRISLRPAGGYRFSRHLKPIAVFFAMSCATVVYTNLDTVMLGVMRGEEAVGCYQAAVKIKGALVGVVASVGTVLLPRVSYYYENEMREAFREMGEKALRLVLLTALPLSAYFLLFAEPMILFFSGKEYLPSVLPMRIIMPALLFIGLTNILGMQILIPQGKERVVLRSEFFGAAADFVLNLLLIPRFSAAGAALGTLAAELVVLAVQLCALREEALPVLRDFSWGKASAGLLAGGLAALPLRAAGLPLFIEILFSAILFFGLYFALLRALQEPLTAEAERQFFAALRGLRPRRKAGEGCEGGEKE